MTNLADDSLRYVLSAGRTGTVFLARLLDRQPGIAAAHEPDSSRYQMMLANLRNDLGIGGGLLKSMFETARERRLRAAAGKVYVEVNPFLCPMTDLLPMPGRELRIVHMVRDPATWAVSILAHEASGRRRALDYVRFGKPYPAPRPPGWGKLGNYERALWRWNWCNGRIEQLRPACEAFVTVRYEDLFAADESSRTATMRDITNALGIGELVHAHLANMSERANASTARQAIADRSAAAAICGALARAYGYDY